VTRALTFEGLTVAAVGLVGTDLRFACAVPIAVAPGSVYSLVVTLGQHCYRVRLCCTGYDPGRGLGEFCIPLAEAGPVGHFFGLNAWSVGASSGGVGRSGLPRREYRRMRRTKARHD
jgi:hypothetical protein